MATTVDKEKVCSFLAKGISQETVAKMLQCDPSYISQLMADDVFRQTVAEQAAQEATELVAQDQTILSIRGKLIKKIDELVECEFKLPNILKAFEVMDRAKSVSGVGAAAPVTGQNVVQLVLPKANHINFVLSPQAQIVEVEGRPLIRAQPSQILEMAKQNEQNRLTTKQLEPPGELTIEELDCSRTSPQLPINQVGEGAK